MGAYAKLLVLMRLTSPRHARDGSASLSAGLAPTILVSSLLDAFAPRLMSFVMTLVAVYGNYFCAPGLRAGAIQVL